MTFDPVDDPRPADRPWPAMVWPPAPNTVLTGHGVELRPAVEQDADELFDALDHDRCWTYLTGRRPTAPAGWRDLLRNRWREGWHPWTVRLDDRVVGTTSYCEVSPVDARLEIGHTIYTPSVWGTTLNPVAKLLLLSHCFEELHTGRVQLKTDVRNTRSQRAIERLGAQYEGTLVRYQRRSDGTVRDTVLFAVTAEHWPTVCRRLTDCLTTDTVVEDVLDPDNQT